MRQPRQTASKRNNGDGNLAPHGGVATGDSSTVGHVVLGVDPGTATMGYGVVGRAGERLMLIDYGVITTSADLDLPIRLQRLYSGLTDLIARFRPAGVAVEELFFNRNTRSALAVGQARGVAMLAAANAGVSVSEYTPLEVKQAIVGYGRASKQQIQRMVCMLLGLDFCPQPDDAADALAIAICHLHSSERARVLSEWMEG